MSPCFKARASLRERVHRHRWVSSAGKFVDRFEEELCRYTGARRCAVVNGTSALHMALKAAGVEAGDECWCRI